MKRKRLLGVVMSALLLALSGCGNAGAGETADSASKSEETQAETPAEENKESELEDTKSTEEQDAEVIELDYMTWNSEDPYIKPIVDAFNESQDRIHVNYKSESTNGEAYQSKILTLLSSGENLDIFGIYSDDLFSRYVELEAVYPLDELIAGGNLDISVFGTGIASMKRNDVYYALPYKKAFDFMIYNKTLFDEHEEEYPENLSWEEMLDLANRMTYKLDNGETVAGLIGGPMSWSKDGLIGLLAQYGELVTDDELPHLEVCMQRIYDVFLGKPGTLSYAETSALQGPALGQIFMGGRAAMMLSGDYFIPMLKSSDVGFEWDVAAFPIDPESDMEENTAVGGMTPVAVTSFCEHPEAAYEFISFLCGEEGAKLLASAGTMPAYSSEAVEEAYKSNAGDLNVETIINSKVLSSYVPLPDEQMGLIRQMTIEEVEKMLIGSQDVSEACKNWDERRREILSGE